jgi:type II secretory pathway pseudopilin PulG
MVSLAIVGLLIVASVPRWEGYLAIQRGRQGTIQIATDLRQAIERAKAERASYSVVLASGSGAYVIGRVGGGFTENATLPVGVSPTATQTILISAYGKPVSALGVPQAYSVSVQSAAGTGVVSVTATGGVSYTLP